MGLKSGFFHTTRNCIAVSSQQRESEKPFLPGNVKVKAVSSQQRESEKPPLLSNVKVKSRFFYATRDRRKMTVHMFEDKRKSNETFDKYISD